MPLTEKPVYYPKVPESSPPGREIIKLQAEDRDIDPSQQITYKIVSGNPEGFFAIDSTAGKSSLSFVRK